MKININTVINLSDSDESTVRLLQYLQEKKKLGDFIAYCIKNNKREIDVKSVVSGLEKDVESLSKSASEIWKMAVEVKSLVALGKRIGLEKTAENLILSEFIISKKLRDIKDSLKDLGIDSLDSDDGKEYLRDTMSLADDVVEYILQSYDGIISEVKSIGKTVTVESLPVVTESEQSEKGTDDKEDNKQNENDTSEKVGKFGENQDLSDLMAFVGM